MEDLIASLYPYDERDQKNGNARKAIDKTENRPRRVEPRRQPIELLGRQSRETTAPPDDENYDGKSGPGDDDPGLELRFSHGPKGGHGFVLGTDASSCDIVLPPLEHPRNGQFLVSRQHCYITFDEHRRLIVQDISSRGTIVTYHGKGGQKRRGFTWIIGGHKVPDEKEAIVIEIAPKLRFQIIVSKEHPKRDLFFDNVDQFRDKIAANDEFPFGALGINSALSTATASGRDTPKRRDNSSPDDILLKQGKLGEGAFSVVSRVWDVSTGLEYASKKFRNLKVSDWRKEADVMRKISHVSVDIALEMLLLTML